MVDTVFQDSAEPACYPNTTIFVNLLGISSYQELRNKEAAFTVIRSIEILQSTDLFPQTFNFEHLKSIHHHLFQDIYDWAGKPRAYDIRKNNDDFTPAKDMPKYENQL